MVASPEQTMNNSDRLTKPEQPYQEEICDKLIQLSFAKIVNSKSERGGARLHKNLLILHLLQKARLEQRNRLLHTSTPMDTTRHVTDQCQEEDISCDDDSTGSTGNEEDGGGLTYSVEYGNQYEQAAIEIDETSSQQQDDEGENELGTFSTSPPHQDDAHSEPSCLSPSAPSASPESGFDGNDGSGTTVIQPPTPPSRQQASSRQTNQPACIRSEPREDVVQLQTAQQHGRGQLETITESGDATRLRHQSDQPQLPRQRRRTSISNKRRVQRKYSSASSSSSSSDSDESSSSEEGYCPQTDDGSDKKSRDCLKRKLDDSSGQDEMAVENSPTSPCEWYSSPKMACIVHGGGVVTETTNLPQQQHQNLNGLISVLQSAALTSDEPTKVASSGVHKEQEEEAQLALDVDGSLPLTRSLSCPGLMELACES